MRRCSAAVWWACAWPQSSLREAVETQLERNAGSYNEYIVSAEYWEQSLPWLVEAIVCRDDCDRARGVHDGFLAAYGLSASDAPLVYFDEGGFADIS